MQKTKKFTLDVGWVFAGSIAIMALQFLRKPIMARYLGPTGLGLYSITTMVVGLIELIAAFGVPSAVIKYVAEYKNDKNKLEPLVSSAVVTMLLFGTMSSILLFIFSDRIANIFDMPSLSYLLKLYAFVFPFSLAYSISLTFFNGLREMKYYSYIDISKSILSFLFIVIFLVLGFGVEGAVIGSVFGIIVGCFIGIKLLRKNIHFTISNYKVNTKKITSFGSRLMLTNAVNVINYQADILMIGYFLTAKDVGYYSIAVSFSQFFWILPQSIQKISFPAASEYWTGNKKQSLNKMIDKSMKLSCIVLLTMGVGLWFFAEDVILFLFGQQFVSSIQPLQILLIGTVIFGIFKSIGGTLPAIGYPGLGLKINTTAAIVNILLNISLIPRFGITGAATATITSFMIVAVLNIYYIKKLANINVDVKWYFLVFGFTIITIFAYSTFSELLNRYILGFLMLITYSVVLFQYFLPREDKEIFKKMISSVISRKVG